MEKEISSGTMLGIVLIALAAVIGIGFGVFSIARGQANDGVAKVQDSLQAVGTQQFADYDQQVVTGNQVTGALKNFEGKPYAIVIRTKALAGSQVTAADHTVAYIANAGSKGFINYNAILSINASGAAPSGATGTIAGGAAMPGTLGSVQLTLNNGTYLATNGFALDGSKEVIFDNATVGVFKSGNAEYVPSSTKFKANLIKDSSGSTIMGIVFEQI